MGTRRKSRELALQSLYQSEFAGIPVLEALQHLQDHFEANRRAYSYAHDLVVGITDHWQEINERIEEHASNWRMDRMSLVDRNIMRVAIFELCYKEDVPNSVAINEAIEVAKRYSTDEAGPFINGILDAVCKGLPEASGQELGQDGST
jgi:N utilization substance protein B